jgi:DNA modification methylase
MSARLMLGDCLEVLRTLEPASIDAIVTDPPYELAFMGRAWDASGIAFSVDLWREALRVLKPGGHLLAFGGTRTYHRMTCAIEDAGFEVRDCLMWVYGSGFPKSLDVSKAIDKIDRIGPIEARARTFTAWMRSTGITAQQVNEATSSFMGSHYLTDKSQPAVATAELFDKLRPLLPPVPDEIEELVRSRTVESENMKRRAVVRSGVPKGKSSGVYGDFSEDKYDYTSPYTDAAKAWSGWGTALKPAWEPIVLARKPLEGTVAGNVLKHGIGGMNIDACRANTRWPANVIHDGSDVVTGLFPSAPGQLATTRADGAQMDNQVYGAMRHPTEAKEPRQDATDSAARFFNALPIEEEDYQPLWYVPKASRAEREEGCEGLPLRTGAEAVDREEGSAGLDNPRAGAGRTAMGVRNYHPTVKPIALMRHLCRLVTPPGGTVLDPFMGSGTTGIAARREGFSFVGIERDEGHFAICKARIGAALPPIFGGANAE